MYLQFKLQSRIHSSKFGPVNHYRWNLTFYKKTLNELGPAWQNRSTHWRKQSHSQTKDIVFSYSDPGGTLGKIKQPKTLIKPRRKRLTSPKRSKKMLLHQRANHTDQKQYISAESWPLSMKQAAKITFTQSKHRTQYIIYPQGKKIIGTSSILARGKTRVLPTDPLSTLCEMVRAIWRDHGSFCGFPKRPLNCNICALLCIDRGYTIPERQVNIFLSQSSVCFFLQPRFLSWNRLQRCARTPHARAITSCSSTF